MFTSYHTAAAAPLAYPHFIFPQQLAGVDCSENEPGTAVFWTTSVPGTL